MACGDELFDSQEVNVDEEDNTLPVSRSGSSNEKITVLAEESEESESEEDEEDADVGVDEDPPPTQPVRVVEVLEGRGVEKVDAEL